MANTWNASDARANFSQVLEDASVHVQRITRRDGKTFVVMSSEQFDESRPKFAEYLASLDTGLNDHEADEFLAAMGDAKQG